jgi:hypothetical protein
MDRHHHRELIVPTTQGMIPMEPMQEFIVPSDDEIIDVLEEDRDIDVERV